MPRLSKEIKEQIRSLDRKALEEIVIKLASKDKEVFDYLIVNYLDKENGEQVLFEDAKVDLNLIFRKRHRGYSDELQLANMLSACSKRISRFAKISKKKNLEADLLMYVLEIPFSLSTNMFGTSFTQYNTKVAMLVKRLTTIVTKHLHEDYKIEYQERINQYLKILHRTSSHIRTVNSLPIEIR